jgi:hypothetical protein
MAHRAGTTAQRIRIGLTGLAFAFLLVLLGSVISRSSREDDGDQIANTATNTPTEPLAELGVAPGLEPAENEMPAEPLAKLGVAPGSTPDKSQSRNSQ